MSKIHSYMLAAFLSCLAGNAFAQDDLILLRNGNEIASKVVKVDSKQVTYKENERDWHELHQDLKDVYMIRFEKRGNIYITADGKRVTGESDKWLKGADRIYLVSGKEIQAYDLRVGEDEITYALPSGSGLFKLAFKKKADGIFSLSPSEVFLIKYADGSKDIINDLSIREEPAKEEVDTLVSELKENERQVTFHNVKAGETLATIAKRYGVTAKELIEWNDLPKYTKATARLQSGTQLMIYVEPAKENGHDE